MEAFGDDYVAHNLPLILLSGLGDLPLDQDTDSVSATKILHDGGFRIKVDLPVLQGNLAQHIRNAFQSHDGSHAAWRMQTPPSSQSKVFRVRSVGRVGQQASPQATLVLILTRAGLLSPTSKSPTSTIRSKIDSRYCYR